MSRTKKYNSSTSQWEYVESVTASDTGAVVSDTTQKLTASVTAPSNPVGGDVWVDPNGKYGADNIDWAAFPQWDVDSVSTSGHASNRTTKTSTSNSTPVYQPSYTLTNPTNKTVTMNFVLAAMGQKTSNGNTQVWMEFNGTKVSPILYYDVLNIWLAFATTFSYTFSPGQSVTVRVAVGGSASGGLADDNGSLANGWPPRLVGSVAKVTEPTP